MTGGLYALSGDVDGDGDIVDALLDGIRRRIELATADVAPGVDREQYVARLLHVAAHAKGLNVGPLDCGGDCR